MFMPAKTDAQYPYGDGYIQINGYGNSQIYYPNYYQTPVYTYTPAPVYYSPAPIIPVPTPVPTPTIYSSTANPNAVKVAPKTVAVAKAKTASSTKNTSVAETKTFADSNLVASAIWGSGGFLPSSLFQWILFAVLIMLTVILVRKIYGGGEKYHAIPMKHD